MTMNATTTTNNNNNSILEITAIMNSPTRNNNNEVEISRSDNNVKSTYDSTTGSFDCDYDYDYNYNYSYNRYDEDYDFAVNSGTKVGGGRGGVEWDSRTKKISSKKVHQDNNTMIYSSKHIRAKEEFSLLDRRKIKNKSNSKMRKAERGSRK
jgi:hypothetical protein